MTSKIMKNRVTFTTLSKLIGQIFKTVTTGFVFMLLFVLAIIALRFSFINLGDDPMIRATSFLLTTTTTVGYGQYTPTSAKNHFFTLFIQLGGIILYGYIFQLVLLFIKKGKVLSEVKRDVNESLESWLIAREKKGFGKDQTVIKKIKRAFDFLWAWDIQSSFDYDLYFKLGHKDKENLFKEFKNFIVNYFRPFFSCFEFEIHGEIVRNMIPI